MRLWQQCMIFLARSPSIKEFMQTRAVMSDLSTRFVGGGSASKAANTALILAQKGVTASLFNLGEYVDDPQRIQQTRDDLEATIQILADLNLDIHISIDPTQIGYQISPECCFNNARYLAEIIRNAGSPNNPSLHNRLMIDMEDASVTGPTLSLFHRLHRKGLPVAITLQAYLHRTRQDLKTIIDQGGMVRLVKGAFAESAAIAWTDQSAIDAQYLKRADQLLSEKARANGCYPVFGTHDHSMIETITSTALKQGWHKREYEFEMLYGVRPTLQRQLVENGFQLRLYLPFGTDWWPYAVRRVGENPKNVKFLINACFKR